MMELNNDQFEQYRHAWLQRHRSWIPNKDSYAAVHSYGRWVTFFVFAVFFAAGSISAVHTIPTVYNTIPKTDFIPEFVRVVVSLGAFIAIEGAVFLSAYILDKMPRMAWTVLGVGFGVAIVANTFSVLGILGSADAGVSIVGLTLGFGAPLIALLMGKMYVDIIKTTKTEDSNAIREYNEACKSMDSQILNDYTLAVQKLERKQPKNTPSVDSPVDSEVSTNVSTNTDKRQLVYTYLLSTEGALEMSLNTIVNTVFDLYGVKVSRSFVGNIKGEVMKEKGNETSNDNG